MSGGRGGLLALGGFENSEEYVARMQEHAPLEDPRPLDTILALYRMGSPEKQLVAAEVDRLRALLREARAAMAEHDRNAELGGELFDNLLARIDEAPKP